MADDYDPNSDAELLVGGWSSRAVEHYLLEARRAARQAPLDVAASFKFGRCQKKDFRSLRSRPMYRGAEHIIMLVECPRLVARSVEMRITKVYKQWERYWGEGTQTNIQLGGGPLGPAPIHVVYLMIPETLIRIGDDLVFRS